MPQENIVSGVKRKDIEGKFNGNESKRLRISTPLMGVLSPNAPCSPSALPGVPSQKTGIELPVDSVETNPHSIWEDRNEHRNAEWIFNQRLLAPDLSGALSCHNRPSLKSMLLITQKKRIPNRECDLGEMLHAFHHLIQFTKVANHAGTKSLHKKIK